MSATPFLNRDGDSLYEGSRAFGISYSVYMAFIVGQCCAVKTKGAFNINVNHSWGANLD